MHQLIDKKNKIIIYLLLLVILSTTNGKFADNQNSHSYTVNQINIEGLSRIDNLKISNDLNNLFYKNILLVGKKEIQKVLNNYSIIEEYSVKKIYPSEINIKIKSTKFVAKLSNNNQLVGANGKLIDSKKNNQILPYIFGKFNSQNFLNFKGDIDRSKFNFIELKAVYLFPSNRWDILTANNILIKLPQKNLLQSLNLAYTIVNSLEIKDKDIIDLRIEGNLIIK